MGLILLIGPTMQIFKMEVNSIGLYASDFIKMSTYTDPFGEGKFSSEWTVFYWGWWIAFMPMMGMFVGKISRKNYQKCNVGTASMGDTRMLLQFYDFWWIFSLPTAVRKS